MSTIGDNIKRIRKEKGLTQEQLGNLCNPKMAGSAIRRYENGGANPKIETIQKIAKALEVSESDLTEKIKLINLFAGTGGIEQALEALTTMTENSNQAMSESMNEAINAMSAMAKDEKELLSDYRNLNSYGKEEARKRVNELTEIPKYQKKDE